MTDSKNNDYFLPFSYAADFFHAQLCVEFDESHTPAILLSIQE